MASRPPIRPLDPARRQDGQVLALFALALVAVLGMAGMLLDGGLAWTNRRQAQNAADAAALAAAKAVSGGYSCTASGRSAASTAAAEIAAANGFSTVTVNYPPANASGAGINGNCSYLEVLVSRPMETGFARVLGQPTWTITARAVAQIANPSQARCNFCSINDTSQNHTLLVKLGSTLTVDGAIYVNSSNGGTGPSCSVSSWEVCGDGFDIFGAGGRIVATTIQTVGGWETHDDGIATATTKAVPGCTSPDPTEYAALGIKSNVCIHQPVLADPLGYLLEPNYNDYPNRNGTQARPSQLRLQGAARRTIDPGVYWGGILVEGTAVLTMNPGVYILASGGLEVTGSASIIGNNVMIYNGSTNGGTVDTGPGVSIVAPDTALPNTTTTLRFSKNPATAGTVIDVTATVKPSDGSRATATGTVTFYDGPTQLAGCTNLPLNKGVAVCKKAFAAGSHQISAIYSGSVRYDGSGAAAVLTVTSNPGTPAGAITIDTLGQVILSPLQGGQYSGLTIFQDRDSTESITVQPNNLLQCASTAPSGEPQGCIGGVSGTIYAAHDNATVYIKASGTANLQVISGQIYIDNGANARFTYKPEEFAGNELSLVE